MKAIDVRYHRAVKNYADRELLRSRGVDYEDKTVTLPILFLNGCPSHMTKYAYKGCSKYNHECKQCWNQESNQEGVKYESD